MSLVLDGVTLTMPPASLSGKEKHAAQRILHMWICPGEKFSHEVSTFNRYGVQLGTKVPLWGGFSGAGKFTLRLWTTRPKMTKPEWEMHVPALKRAVVDGGCTNGLQRAKVWHDNERFLLCPGVCRREGLEQTRFPPNSGDLNRIETVWARLRKDLAAREQEAGEGPHSRSVQAPCSSDSPILFHRKAWRQEELLAKAGTGNDEEAASMPLECLRTFR